jgi:hypothetical protein
LTEREQINLLCQVENYMSITDKHSQAAPEAVAEENRMYDMVNGFIAKRFSDIGAAVRGEAAADEATNEIMRHFVANISGLELRAKIKATVAGVMPQFSARAADAHSEQSDQTALLKLLRRLLDGSQPKDVMGAVMVIDNALGGKVAWEYAMTPPAAFCEYVSKNYSGDVNFQVPEWHAIRLWNAAMRSITGKSRAADVLDSQPTDGGVRNG